MQRLIGEGLRGDGKPEVRVSDFFYEYIQGHEYERFEQYLMQIVKKAYEQGFQDGLKHSEQK